MGAFDYVKSFLYNKEIVGRVFVTLLILFIFRLLSKVPAPGVEKDALDAIFGGSQSQASLFNIANVLAGGTLSNFSIISIGLVAFISASVIFQLLGSIVPKIEELQKMGEIGRKIIDQWTRILTVPIAAIQSYLLYLFLKSSDNFVGRPLVEDLSNLRVVTLVLTLVAGTMLLVWLAELCSEHGLGGRRGGGISIIITAGILASIPTSIIQAFSNFVSSDYLKNFWLYFGLEWLLFFALYGLVLLFIFITRRILNLTNIHVRNVFLVLYILLFFAIFAGAIIMLRGDYEWVKQLRTLWEANIARLDTLETRFGFFLALTIQLIGITTFFNESYRKIPIKFISRINNFSRQSIDTLSYLPIKLLSVGVMPIIFALSFLSLPGEFYRFFGESIKKWDGIIRFFGLWEMRLFTESFVQSFYRVLEYASLGWLNPFTSPYYHVLHFILTVLFSLFFISVVMKPDDVANALKARKSFIPGVRPGNETIQFISSTIFRVTFWGGLFLAILSSLPYIFNFYNSQVPLGIESLIAGGTSILIVVSTILSIKTQIDALILTKNYEKFEDI
jgi:preprotein translocase SecY subunit